MKRVTQKERVLEFIKKEGSITSLDAFRELGCTRLSAVIFKLKEEGYEFETKFEAMKNRWGDTVSFARYSIKE